MKREILPMFACPECLSDLELKVKEEDKEGNVKTGLLVCKICNREYPISHGIPNFIPDHPLNIIES